MGDLVPLRESPWLRPAPDWNDTCDGCPIRSACRAERDCQWPAPAPVPDVTLRLVEPPDIVA